jgi:hypothetical protein
MKDIALMLIFCFTLVLCVVLVKTDFYDSGITSVSFDPNAPMYRYLPKPPPAWTTQYGETEASRVAWAITALRVEQVQQGKKLALVKDICFNDPNEGGK